MSYLSQNFLVDKSYLPLIMEAADLNDKDTVLEIGPGQGVLTEKLCQKSQKVIAVELDKKLIANLKNLQTNFPNLQIIEGDFNRLNWRQEVGDSPYKIVANIPYHITGLIFRTIFDYKQSLPTKVVLMIQWEVAKKILAKPDDQNKLSNLINCFGRPQLVCKVDKRAFRPVPKVDSAVIMIDEIKKPEVEDFDQFFQIIKLGFSSRRKTLLNNLSTGLKQPKNVIIELLQKINIDPTRRAQTLDLNEWKSIFSNISELRS